MEVHLLPKLFLLSTGIVQVGSTQKFWIFLKVFLYFATATLFNLRYENENKSAGSKQNIKLNILMIKYFQVNLNKFTLHLPPENRFKFADIIDTDLTLNTIAIYMHQVLLKFKKIL